MQSCKDCMYWDAEHRQMGQNSVEISVCYGAPPQIIVVGMQMLPPPAIARAGQPSQPTMVPQLDSIPPMVRADLWCPTFLKYSDENLKKMEDYPQFIFDRIAGEQARASAERLQSKTVVDERAATEINVNEKAFKLVD